MPELQAAGYCHSSRLDRNLNTAARTVPTPANPTVTTNAVPVDTLVIEKKDDRKKTDSKNEGAKSDSSTKKEGNKPR